MTVVIRNLFSKNNFITLTTYAMFERQRFTILAMFIGGTKTVVCLSGKGHGKNKILVAVQF